MNNKRTKISTRMFSKLVKAVMSLFKKTSAKSKNTNVIVPKNS